MIIQSLIKKHSSVSGAIPEVEASLPHKKILPSQIFERELCVLFTIVRNKTEPERSIGKTLHTRSALQSWEYPKTNQENAGNKSWRKRDTQKTEHSQEI